MSVSTVHAPLNTFSALLLMSLKSSAKQSSTCRITTFIRLGGGAMVSVEQANEIVAKMRELETEQNLMKDLFNRALRMSQSSGHAERHMPGMFNGKADYTEYTFKMEACMSTLDPAGKGGEILRAVATEVKDMDDAEVANLAAIYWNVFAHNSALASSLITKTARLFVECCRHSRDLASECAKS